jgi:hypothetical protein
MAIVRTIKQKHQDGWLCDHVQVLTGKSTATAVLGYGITRIDVASATESGSSDFVFRLDNPVAVGVSKYLFVSPPDGTTKDVSVRTLSSATGYNFFDSTCNSIRWSSLAGNPADAVHLVGLSTVVWGVVNRQMSSAVSLAGATAT